MVRSILRSLSFPLFQKINAISLARKSQSSSLIKKYSAKGNKVTHQIADFPDVETDDNNEHALQG